MCQDSTKSLIFTKRNMPSVCTTDRQQQRWRRRCRNKITEKKFGWGNFTISIINVIIEGREMKNLKYWERELKRIAGLRFDYSGSECVRPIGCRRILRTMYIVTPLVRRIILFGICVHLFVRFVNAFYSEYLRTIIWISFSSVRNWIELENRFSFVQMTLFHWPFEHSVLQLHSLRFPILSLFHSAVVVDRERSRVLKSSRWHSNN